MNANLRNFALWVIIVLLLLALFTLFQNPGQRTNEQDISFSQVLTEVDQGRVHDVVIQGPDIHGTFANGTSFQTYAPNDPGLVQKLYSKGVAITALGSTVLATSRTRGAKSDESPRTQIASRTGFTSPSARGKYTPSSSDGVSV